MVYTTHVWWIWEWLFLPLFNHMTVMNGLSWPGTEKRSTKSRKGRLSGSSLPRSHSSTKEHGRDVASPSTSPAEVPKPWHFASTNVWMVNHWLLRKRIDACEIQRFKGSQAWDSRFQSHAKPQQITIKLLQLIRTKHDLQQSVSFTRFQGSSSSKVPTKFSQGCKLPRYFSIPVVRCIFLRPLQKSKDTFSTQQIQPKVPCIPWTISSSPAGSFLIFVDIQNPSEEMGCQGPQCFQWPISGGSYYLEPQLGKIFGILGAFS